MLKCADTPSISYNSFQSLNKVGLIDAGESDFYSEEIENFLNDDSIPMGIENSVFNMKKDILFLERLLSEDPLPPMNPNQAKSSIEAPVHSFSIGYEHFSTTLVMELDKITESSIKNLVPIPRECEVTSDNASFENDDSAEEIDAVDDLHVDNSISNSKNELSDNEESDFDNPSFPRPPPKPLSLILS
nr:hypothetical protein [Tanacetum cinerariifolium]